jgi:hypothetical protein
MSTLTLGDTLMAARVTASKKAAAKKTAPQPLGAPPPLLRPTGAPFEPLRLSSAPEEAPDLVDLFEVDGTMYSVPSKPSASIALRYLDAAENLGPQAANLYVLREMLGEDGYKALSTCRALTDTQLTWIVETVQGLVLGTIEAPKA